MPGIALLIREINPPGQPGKHAVELADRRPPPVLAELERFDHVDGSRPFTPVHRLEPGPERISHPLAEDAVEPLPALGFTGGTRSSIPIDQGSHS